MNYDNLSSRILDALADPTRRAIVERLRGGPMAVGRIAEGLPVSRPAVSQHLKVLGEAGLVRHQIEGTRHLYALQAGGVGALREYLDTVWGDALQAFAAHVRQKENDP
jgi:DNA-binding transcriptional ArsR family regulator